MATSKANKIKNETTTVMSKKSDLSKDIRILLINFPHKPK